MKYSWMKYVFTFIITAVIFLTAIVLSNYLNDQRIEEIQAIEDSIAIDILSSETQFQLLEDLSCEDIDNSFLSNELGELGQRLQFTEENQGADNEQVKSLKRYYSLLLIKDHLLMKQASSKCDFKPVFILYFYSNKGDCEECTREGYVLTRLREKYPRFRIYSFDYNLDLSAIDTLKYIYGLDGRLPALIVGDDVHYGFRSVEDIEALIPELAELEEATSTATTTSDTE